jgi:hypothetical protein
LPQYRRKLPLHVGADERARSRGFLAFGRNVDGYDRPFVGLNFYSLVPAYRVAPTDNPAFSFTGYRARVRIAAGRAAGITS